MTEEVSVCGRVLHRRLGVRPSRDANGKPFPKGTAARANQGKPWFAVINVDTISARAEIAPEPSSWDRGVPLDGDTRLLLMTDLYAI